MQLRVGGGGRSLRRAVRPGAPPRGRRRNAGRRRARAGRPQPRLRGGVGRRARPRARRGRRAPRPPVPRSWSSTSSTACSGISGSDVAAVVASQGHDDDVALETILKRGVSYVGLVASRKRGAAIRAALGRARRARDRDDPAVPRASTSARGCRQKWRCRCSPRSSSCSPSLSPVYGTTCGAHEQPLARSPRGDAPLRCGRNIRHSPAEPTPIDPVCGMKVEIDGRAAHRRARRRHRTTSAVRTAGQTSSPTRNSSCSGSHDGRRNHPGAAARARLHRRRELRDRAAAGARRSKSRCSSKDQPASARPRAPRCSPSCSTRASSACSATRGWTR